MTGVPDAVTEVAQRIDRGVHPARFIEKGPNERGAYASLKAHEDWEQMAGCGCPHYLHKPSGYVVAVGERTKTAILSPNQMKNVPTLMVDYYRYRNGQDHTFGLVSREPFRDLATEPTDDGDFRWDANEIRERFFSGLTDEQEEAIERLQEAFDQ